MIRLNRRTKVAGTRATPGRTGAGKVRALAMARGYTPKRAVVIGSLAAAMTVSMIPVAGAHGGDGAKVHACVVSSSGSIRIVGADESCRNGETPLDWSVGSVVDLNDLVTEVEMRALLGQLRNDESVGPKQPNDLDGFLHWNHLEGIPGYIADNELSVLRNTLENGFSDDWDYRSFSVDGGLIQEGTISTRQLAGDDTDDPAIPWDDRAPGAVTSQKILDGTIEARDLGQPLTELLDALQAKVAALESRVAELERKAAG